MFAVAIAIGDYEIDCRTNPVLTLYTMPLIWFLLLENDYS